MLLVLNNNKVYSHIIIIRSQHQYILGSHTHMSEHTQNYNNVIFSWEFLHGWNRDGSLSELIRVSILAEYSPMNTKIDEQLNGVSKLPICKNIKRLLALGLPNDYV